MAVISTRLDVLRGTLDPENPLHKLRGNALVWRDVFSHVTQWYDQHLDTTTLPFKSLRRTVNSAFPEPHGINVAFPEPRGININMMPIRAAYHHAGWGFELPEAYSQYRPLVDACPVPWDYYFENGTTDRVAYLTIHEKRVPVGQAHRRPGLHIESPVVVGGAGHQHTLRRVLNWGRGHWDKNVLVDGIYMASNVPDSCAVWPCLVKQPGDVVDRHGGIEHMRDYMAEQTRTKGVPRLLGAGELCWITDRTPHESLPLKPPEDDHTAGFVYRQFFRLVVGPVSVWYAKHNTPSPLGVQPTARISYQDKFAADLSAALPKCQVRAAGKAGNQGRRRGCK